MVISLHIYLKHHVARPLKGDIFGFVRVAYSAYNILNKHTDGICASTVEAFIGVVPCNTQLMFASAMAVDLATACWKTSRDVLPRRLTTERMEA